MKKFWMANAMIAGFITLTSIISCSGSSELVVSNRPEPPYYARPMSPGSGWVWIEGDWVVRGGRYQWREGHWARARNRAWVGGSWESRNSGYYWRRGHWR